MTEFSIFGHFYSSFGRAVIPAGSKFSFPIQFEISLYPLGPSLLSPASISGKPLLSLDILDAVLTDDPAAVLRLSTIQYPFGLRLYTANSYF